MGSNSEVFDAISINKAKGSFDRAEQVFQYPASTGKPGATASVGYTNTGIDTQMITLAASATADTWIIPITGLHEGDVISEIGICGQGESAANAYTIDYELRAQTAAAGDCTDASIQAGTQIAKSADYLVNDTTAVATPHTLISGEHPYMLITCTTAAVTDIQLLYVSVKVTQQ